METDYKKDLIDIVGNYLKQDIQKNKEKNKGKPTLEDKIQSTVDSISGKGKKDDQGLNGGMSKKEGFLVKPEVKEEEKDNQGLNGGMSKVEGGVKTEGKEEEKDDQGLNGGMSSVKNRGGIITPQEDINPEYANKESEKVVSGTEEALTEIVKDIRTQLNEGTIDKNKAKEALTIVKEHANLNFNTSISDNLKMKGIDNSFENRKVIAGSLGISDYEGTYEQNVKMLKELMYMDNNQINDLISKK